MRTKFNYRVYRYDVDDVPQGVLDADWVSSSLSVGLRLEDLKSPDDASKAGFKKVDELTYIKEAGGSVEASVNDMCSIFISSYVFQSDTKRIFGFDEEKRDTEKFIRDLVVGPLNKLKYKKESIEIVADDKVYAGVKRIIMLDSMEPIILVLDQDS